MTIENQLNDFFIKELYKPNYEIFKFGEEKNMNFLFYMI
jgi:hypothetical protein